MTEAAAQPKPAGVAKGRQKPTTAAKASRWVAAGAAVGTGLAMVGTMAGAAANADTDAQPIATPTVRRVVIPQRPAAVEPIVIVLPQQTGAAGQAPAVITAVAPVEQPARPEPAPAPAVKAAPAPASKSSGS